jgi:hypothetical protein
VAREICGRSVGDADRDLWKGIVALFEDRNAVAHRGQDISVDRLRDHLMAATEALTWAEGLRS